MRNQFFLARDAARTLDARRGQVSRISVVVGAVLVATAILGAYVAEQHDASRLMAAKLGEEIPSASALRDMLGRIPSGAMTVAGVLMIGFGLLPRGKRLRQAARSVSETPPPQPISKNASRVFSQLASQDEILTEEMERGRLISGRRVRTEALVRNRP